LARVTDRLAALRATNPRLVCPECGADMVLRESKYGPFYGCTRYPACDASHGAHPDGTPLGVPADKETKAARIAAHAAFDQLWDKASKAGRAAARRGAYRWLREQLGMTREECHIGRFDKAMCTRVIELCEARLRGDECP
jgi:ssDNA-binding Zn-finger/Zn-ribbon topoisomerase 1